MSTKISQITGLLYVLLHSYINIPQEESDELPDNLLEWSFAYHILHPDGRGVDVQCLLTGGNYMQCLEQMQDNRNREMMVCVYNDIYDWIWTHAVIGTDIQADDMDWYIDTKIVPLSDRYRRPEDVITQKILTETPAIYAAWQPSPEQEFLRTYMPIKK